MAVDRYTPELIARNKELVGERGEELERWSEDLRRWNAELEREEPARRREGAVVLEDAEKKRGAAMERLREVQRQNVGDEDAWREMRDAIDLACDQAKEALQEAKDWFTGGSGSSSSSS